MKKCIYTAIIGDYDKLHTSTTPKLKDWDYICFTNNKNLKSNFWNIKYIESDSLSDVKLARKIKIKFDEYVSDYDIILWKDANIVINTNLNLFINKHLLNYDLVVSKHFQRNCIYKEAEELIKLKYALKEDVLKQISDYKNDNYPHNNGLVETGVMIRKNNENTIKFCDLWWNEILKHTHRDQLSFNYVLWKYPININIIKSPVRYTREFLLLNHNKNRRLK